MNVWENFLRPTYEKHIHNNSDNQSKEEGKDG